jgi:hypothetical protein
MNLVLRVLALSLLGPAASAQEALRGFDWFGDLTGSCWVGVFADGVTEHTQCYTTQFGVFMRGTAALAEIKDGKRELRFEGDSLFAWDESSRRIAYFIWGSDGSYRELDAEFVGDELHFPVPRRDDAAQILYRSVWRRIDADTFEVRRERPEAGGWTTELTVVYHRAPAQN